MAYTCLLVLFARIHWVLRTPVAGCPCHRAPCHPLPTSPLLLWMNIAACMAFAAGFKNFYPKGSKASGTGSNGKRAADKAAGAATHADA